MEDPRKGDVSPVELKLLDTTDTTAISSLTAQKQSTFKRIAQGLEIVLLTENVNQLKFIIQTNGSHHFYHLVIGLICASISLQVTIGLSILCIGPLSINKKTHRSRSKLLNVAINTLIFLVLIINIFVSSLVVEQGSEVKLSRNSVKMSTLNISQSTNMEALKKLVCN